MKKEDTTQGLRALIAQGQELLHRLTMILMKTHTTIMWMFKCFNNKLKKRSKLDFESSKNDNALKKSVFGKRISMFNSNKNKNAFDMIKS
jgi:hypothetical protein